MHGTATRRRRRRLGVDAVVRIFGARTTRGARTELGFAARHARREYPTRGGGTGAGRRGRTTTRAARVFRWRCGLWIEVAGVEQAGCQHEAGGIGERLTGTPESTHGASLPPIGGESTGPEARRGRKSRAAARNAPSLAVSRYFFRVGPRARIDNPRQRCSKGVIPPLHEDPKRGFRGNCRRGVVDDRW